MSNSPAHLEEQLHIAIKHNRMVEAIKIYRQMTACKVAEAAEHIKQNWDELRTEHRGE